MNIRLNTTPVCLAENQALTVSRGKGSLISCLRGTVWITQHDDLRDIVLASGESFRLDRKGPALVWALAASSVEMRPAPLPRPTGAAVLRWLEQVRAITGLAGARRPLAQAAK